MTMIHVTLNTVVKNINEVKIKKKKERVNKS